MKVRILYPIGDKLFMPQYKKWWHKWRDVPEAALCGYTTIHAAKRVLQLWMSIKNKAIEADFLEINLINEKFRAYKRPALGLLPKRLHMEARLLDINSAIRRFEEGNREIPTEWREEQEQLCSELMTQSYHEWK